MNTWRRLGVLVLAAFVCGAGPATAEDRTDPAVIEEWSKAAMNRENAAIVLQRQAEELLRQAAELKCKEYDPEDIRRLGFNRAGDVEKSAGDLYMSVSANLDVAVADWNMVSKIHKKDGDRENQRNAAGMSELAGRSSLEALMKAAEAYELAADSYGEGNAEQPAKEAAASTSAAVARELSAQRQ